MKNYTCSGFRAVKAESMRDAAEIFATRQARRDYAKKGYTRTLNLEAHSQDNTLAEWSAFIGYSTGRNETTGHNFRFTVYAQ